ncbi:MAG: penicillin-binding protein 2 [Patescibacteria group bacterium]|nr:penicillin-binding protein 2 [Patescibacteria group bacterium]
MNDKLFAWQEEGSYGLEVELEEGRGVAPEVMYEDEVLKIKERPLYIGLPLPRSRFDIALVVSLIVLLLLVGRAFWMQVKDHYKYMALSERNRLRTEIVQPTRGIIRDRQGKILADNMPTFDVSVTPIDLPADTDARLDLIGRISRVAGIPLTELQEDVSGARSPDQRITVARDIAYEQAIALKIELSDVPGVSISTGQKRRYAMSTENPSFSHILGYLGKLSTGDLDKVENEGYSRTDLLGKAGVEATYESLLRGTPGDKVTEVDSFGHEQRIVHEGKSIPGKDLVLSIDADFQKQVETLLKNGLEKAKVKKGSAIAIDPRDGSILAVVSWPSYDDNIFSGRVSSTAYAAYLNDENNPFLARAWAGLFPSGSSIKPVYATALLAEHVITPHTTVMSTGGVRLGASFFPDWAAGGHGLTDVRKAIAMSVNTFFYITCGGYDNFKGLGAEKMSEWLKKFGFGSKLGLDIPGELAGLVPSPAWKEEKKKEHWYVGDTYNFAIGQGDFLVTPLQIAVATAEIANGGHPIIPHVALNNFKGTPTTTALAPPEAVSVVRAGMRDTIVYGSGRALSVLPFTSAGKTGTAQWRNDKPNHAWFTSFAPYENPRIVVTVMLEEGVEGSSTAVPIARDILAAWNRLGL